MQLDGFQLRLYSFVRVRWGRRDLVPEVQYAIQRSHGKLVFARHFFIQAFLLVVELALGSSLAVANLVFNRSHTEWGEVLHEHADLIPLQHAFLTLL